MKRKRITVMWMPSASSRSRIVSLPPLLLYILVGMLVVSWVLLGTGGYLGKRLYREYLELREKNSYLLQKKRELEALHHTMERIQEEESTIRDYLGLEENHDQRGDLGPGE